MGKWWQFYNHRNSNYELYAAMRSKSHFCCSPYPDSGCGYEWCIKMPRMTVSQFMLGFVLGVVGYPFSLTLSASIFSKVVGDINPGYWLGLFNTFGSTARVIGPLLVTEVYQELGTYAMTFLVIVVLVSDERQQ